MSTEVNSLEERLAEVKEKHRRRHLSDELDELAETMEETILQHVLAKEFFRVDIEIDAESKEQVREVRTHLENEEYETVEERLDELTEQVELAETMVENRIQELRLKHNSTVTAMRRLNDRVDRVSDMRLEALEGLLGEWRWKEHVYLKDEAEMETLKRNAREYGQEMRSAFEELKDQLFGFYPDEIRDLIYRMIDDERLSYADLTDNQRRLLAESDVAEFIELTLS